MIGSLLRWLRQKSRRIHVRVILYAILNMVALAAAVVVGPLIPEGASDVIGAGSVDQILEIIATSMLAVTTFSLTIMVTGFSRAEGRWTPRSHLLLREDTRTQSVLATFLGAYLYALIAIILRAADVFGEAELVVVFFMTLFVVATIIISIIRWIVHLEGYGSLTLTARQLEDRAAKAVRDMARRPAQGANPLTGATDIPEGTAIRASKAGYVTQIFEEALQDIAAELDARIHLRVPVGRYVLKGDVLASVSGAAGTDLPESRLRASIEVQDVRNFEADPVFGVIVMAEIATRALSPGVNDPGTAIDILHRLSRVIAEAGAEPEEDLPRFDRVWIAAPDLDALFEASFDPIARAAGDTLEVHLAMARALRDIARAGNGPLRDAARRAADAHAARARRSVDYGPDLARLEARLARA